MNYLVYKMLENSEKWVEVQSGIKLKYLSSVVVVVQVSWYSTRLNVLTFHYCQ